MTISSNYFINLFQAPISQAPFQKRLIGASADWYGRQNKETVKTWKDLAEAFLDQYSFNIAQAPDRTDLRNMEKKNSETFKEYAQGEYWLRKFIPGKRNGFLLHRYLETSVPWVLCGKCDHQFR